MRLTINTSNNPSLQALNEQRGTLEFAQVADEYVARFATENGGFRTSPIKRYFGVKELAPIIHESPKKGFLKKKAPDRVIQMSTVSIGSDPSVLEGANSVIIETGNNHYGFSL